MRQTLAFFFLLSPNLVASFFLGQKLSKMPPKLTKMPPKLTKIPNTSGAEQTRRREFLPSLFLPSLFLPSLILPILPTLLLPSQAYAERTLTTLTESYNRYVPRMNTGFAYLKELEMLATEGSEDIGLLNSVIEDVEAERGSNISALKGTMKILGE